MTAPEFRSNSQAHLAQAIFRRVREGQVVQLQSKLRKTRSIHAMPFGSDHDTRAKTSITTNDWPILSDALERAVFYSLSSLGEFLSRVFNEFLVKGRHNSLMHSRQPGRYAPQSPHPRWRQVFRTHLNCPACPNRPTHRRQDRRTHSPQLTCADYCRGLMRLLYPAVHRRRGQAVPTAGSHDPTAIPSKTGLRISFGTAAIAQPIACQNLRDRRKIANVVSVFIPLQQVPHFI